MLKKPFKLLNFPLLDQRQTICVCHGEIMGVVQFGKILFQILIRIKKSSCFSQEISFYVCSLFFGDLQEYFYY